MAIKFDFTSFVDSEYLISFTKDFGDNKTLSAHIVLGTQQFSDYQRDLIEDFLSVLADQLSTEDVSMSVFKKEFEKQLQDLNTKLTVFAEKIKDIEKFHIKGIVQVFFDGIYVASMIGKVSVMIFRDHKLNYSLTNYTQDASKIDLFTEFVEGDVNEDDEIVAIGIPAETYLDRDDYAAIVQMSRSHDQSLPSSFVEVLTARLSQEEIGFILSSLIELSGRFSQKKIKKNLIHSGSKILDKIGPIQRFKGPATITGIVIVVLLLIYALVQSFLNANKATFVDRDGGVVIDFTIDDIQKDIALFKKLDSSSNEKIKKYNEIITQLDLLDSNNRRTYDVAELRKILETEYYKGFNIVLINNNSFFQEPVYEFSQQEKNVFGNPQQIYYTNSLQIAGDEGVLLGAINDTARGTLISAGVDTKLNMCGLNLLSNGFYCKTDTDALFNIIKSGLQPMGNVEGSFPGSIMDIGTYRSSNMYVLTQDTNLQNIPIVRYTNQIGSQENFGEGTQYTLDSQALEEYPNLAQGFSSFAIDGTFLAWSSPDKALYQMWREGIDTTLYVRQVPLIGGDTVGDQYGDNIKIIATDTDRLVYLFDQDNQTFTVYRSTPYKTNDATTTDYSLAYFFRMKFGLPEMAVRDVYVEEGEKSILYILTDNGVYSLNLYDFLDTFYQKESAEG